jgi:hypothetical protein
MMGDWWSIETVADGETQGANRAEESVAARMTEARTAPLLQVTGE